MRKVILNILVNLGLMAGFVLWANNALNEGLEETLVSLMIIYGVIVVIVNALFMILFWENSVNRKYAKR